MKLNLLVLCGLCCLPSSIESMQKVYPAGDFRDDAVYDFDIAVDKTLARLPHHHILNTYVKEINVVLQEKDELAAAVSS